MRLLVVDLRKGMRNGTQRVEISRRYVTPMAYSLKQAAEASSRTKPTILRAIQTGKISAKKNELGEWEIDPAELHRVYAPVTEGDAPVTPDEDEEPAVELLLLRGVTGEERAYHLA